MKKRIFIFLWVLFVVPCTAETIIVDCNGSGDYTTIQSAINYSSNGDTIVVKPGTYNENVYFYLRAVTLTSDPNEPNAVESTIIAASSDYSVNFTWWEGPDSVLTGFTITGGGIYCNESSPTISQNIIDGCLDRGIYCIGGSAVISGNIIRNCAGKGIYGTVGATPVISGNAISSNGDWGIDGCDGPITNNVVSENDKGIAYCDGFISNNIIRNNDDGGMYFCNAEIVGNIIANNFSYSGGGLYRCGGNIRGNVIVANKAEFIAGGLYRCKGSASNNIVAGNECQYYGGGFCNDSGGVDIIDIYNNTIVGNRSAIGGGAIGDCFGVIYNNIIAFNRSDEVGGISNSPNHYYNVFWENEVGSLDDLPGTGDVVIDPYFAVEGYWDSNGTPDKSDDFWVDGDYHIKSEAGRWEPGSKTWVFDGVTSPCVDGGYPASDWSEELWPHGERANIGAYGGTTQASMSLSGKNNAANLTDEAEPNDWVGYDDLMLFTDQWLSRVNDVALAEVPGAGEIYQLLLEYIVHVPLAEDIDRDGVVNFIDYAIIAMNWNPEPPPALPPEPNVMTWEMVPYGISRYEVAMVATTATSTDGSGVEYYFQNITIGGHDSGWQAEPNYTDSGLSAGTNYGYKVQARNSGNHEETEWSQQRFASTFPPDTTPPNPDPAEWEEEPHRISSTSIRMVAGEANDESGVEYYFKCTSHPNESSDWQDSPEYVAVVLPGYTYSFMVQARDKSPAQNTTGFSNEITVDLDPPTPDPMQWAVGGEPDREQRGSSYWAVMTSVEATDEGGDVEYFFGCTTSPYTGVYPSGFSSGWISEPTWEVELGINPGLLLWFHVKARDASGNETAWSPLDRAD